MSAAFDAQSLARIKTVRAALGPTFAFLRGKCSLWHRTSIEGLRGILAAGAILPNDRRFPFRYPQSKISYARRCGAVSLFDIYSLPEEWALLMGMDWVRYLTDQPRATVWIRIDPARLHPDRLLLPRELSARLSSIPDTHPEWGECLAYVEALYRGPLPCSAFVEFVVFRGVQKWITVPMGNDALDTIERQCRKWNAEDDAVSPQKKKARLVGTMSGPSASGVHHPRERRRVSTRFNHRPLFGDALWVNAHTGQYIFRRLRIKSPRQVALAYPTRNWFSYGKHVSMA